jgi:hypothetical protein
MWLSMDCYSFSFYAIDDTSLHVTFSNSRKAHNFKSINELSYVVILSTVKPMEFGVNEKINVEFPKMIG